MKIPTKVPPVRLVNAVQRVRHHLLRLHRSLAPAPAVMAELITGAWLAQTITVAADLRIADALNEKPLDLHELANRVGANPDALGRLLRALISRGVFRQRRDGRYELTPLASTLRWARQIQWRRSPGLLAHRRTASIGAIASTRSAPVSRSFRSCVAWMASIGPRLSQN
jgi:hypothetical protein